MTDVNAHVTALEQAVITCIKADQPVFFGKFISRFGRVSVTELHVRRTSGSDVGASLIRDKGILDTKAYEYEVRPYQRTFSLHLTHPVHRNRKPTGSSST